MNRRDIEDIYPLTPMQQGMVFHSVRSPESGMYVEQIAWRVFGDLDLRAFDTAWQRVLRRHSALRTAFLWEGLEEMLQVVYRDVTVPIAHLDWTEYSGEGQTTKLQEFLDADRGVGFDLADPPLMRITLIRAKAQEHVLVWTHHHVLLDGWSFPIVTQEFNAIYLALAGGGDIHLPPVRPFRDYIAWYKAQDPGAAETYWRETLRGFTTPTPLVMERPLGVGPTGPEYPSYRMRLKESTSVSLTQLAKRIQTTPSAILKGALAVVLSRYSGEEDVVLGETISGRPPEIPDVESIVGLFINTLPVRIGLPRTESVFRWLATLHAKLSEAQQFGYASLVDLQRWSEVPTGTPLFECLFVYESYPVASDDGAKKPFRIEQLASLSRTNFPLVFVVSPGPTFGLELAYDARRFHRRAIEQMGRHFERVLEEMLRDPQQSVSSLSLLSRGEEEALTVGFNKTVAPFSDGQCIQALVEEQARAQREHTAVVGPDGVLTYGDLDARANQIAHWLQGRGVGPEVLVAICMDRSAEMIAVILGVLKAGGAFLPIDPAYPSDRIAYMLDDSGATLLLTQETLLDKVPAGGRLVVCLEHVRPSILQEQVARPESPVTADNLAYVIYTSGSTGRPKGVLLQHRGLCNFTEAQCKAWAIEPGSRVLQFASISFDASVAEIFLALTGGATLQIVDRETASSVAGLEEFIRRNETTTATLPPTVLAILDPSRVPTLQVLGSAGEACTWEIVRRWKNCRRFLNAYGPTEGTVGASWNVVSADDIGPASVPIGKPFQNVRVYILDPLLRPVPVGITGELYIGGVGVARGYLGRPELTAERFVPDPFSTVPGVRLYRTGDLGRFLVDGTIEYAGRADHQVKIRGFRIELGEIEARISDVAGVREVAVVVWTNQLQERQLVAYVACHAETDLTATSLQEHLKTTLPDYMIPATIMFLDALPLTSNGKVDRRALPAPTGTKSGASAAPRSITEQLLAKVWEGVLDVENPSVTDNFFGQGGHSLRATQLVSRIRDVFDVELPLQAVFDHPVLEDLAAAVDAAKAGVHERVVPGLQIVPRTEDIPLSFAQQRLWFLDQLTPGSPMFNIPSAFRLRGSLDLEVLRHSLTEILRRHEVLRTTFQTKDGKPIQVIGPPGEFDAPVLDLSHLAEEDAAAEAMTILAEEAARPFDLATGPLFRVMVLRMGVDDHIAAMTWHHIISDGWSIGVFLKELSILYEAFSKGQHSPLPDLEVQYADFAAWQRTWLQGEVLDRQLAFWKKELAGAPPALEIPTDRPRPHVQTFHGSRETLHLTAEFAGRIRELSRQNGVTEFMTLLAAFQALLHRYTGQDDIVIGTPIAGRRHSSLEHLIGFFVNNLVLRATFSPELSFEESLLRVRETALRAFAHQDVPFEKLVEELHPVRDLSHAPVFQVMFVYQNTALPTMQFRGITIEGVRTTGKQSTYDLTLEVSDTGGGVVLELEYNTDLFDATTIRRMLGHFHNLLEDAVRHPEEKITRLRLLSEEETALQLHAWNQTVMPFPDRVCAHEVFEAFVARTPDALAVEFVPTVGNGEHPVQLSYATLNSRANRLARYLRSRGLRQGDHVGVFLQRSPEVVVAVLAALKAGAAFLPLDPDYPAERLGFMIQDSGTSFLITQDALRAHIPSAHAQIVVLDDVVEELEREDDSNLALPLDPDVLAYLIYTSGSTGRPKGSMLAHRGLCNLAMAQQRAFDIRSGSKILQFSALSFDASVWEIVMALLNGATLVLTRREVIMNGHDLVKLLAVHHVTTMTLPPSVLAVLPVPDLPRLDTVITAGEKCTAELLQRWGQGRRFVNAYGPSETTVCASMFTSDGRATPVPPIGRPIANFDLYIFDRHGEPVPVGVPGELYIGGIGLARGYVHRPELTAERFVPHPFSTQPGARLYRSGDLCRYLPDGMIEFLGRVDHQVKIRGFRIELGEIETLLASLSWVRDVAVLAREDVPGEKRLVAYIVAGTDDRLPVAELKTFLRTRLPEFMVPSHFVFMEAFPLTSNNKVDRRALPPPEGGMGVREVEFVEARNPQETQLAKIVGDLLSIDRVGVYDNFFDLGGHSLLATQFISRVREVFGVEMPLRVLFEKPTVAELAMEIDVLKSTGIEAAAHPAIRRVSRESARKKRSDLKH